MRSKVGNARSERSWHIYFFRCHRRQVGNLLNIQEEINLKYQSQNASSDPIRIPPSVSTLILIQIYVFLYQKDDFSNTSITRLIKPTRIVSTITFYY